VTRNGTIISHVRATARAQGSSTKA
jgi:hypothetical protein